jgi:hypothetical protein
MKKLWVDCLLASSSSPLFASMVMVLQQFPNKLITNNLTCGVSFLAAFLLTHGPHFPSPTSLTCGTHLSHLMAGKAWPSAWWPSFKSRHQLPVRASSSGMMSSTSTRQGHGDGSSMTVASNSGSVTELQSLPLPPCLCRLRHALCTMLSSLGWPPSPYKMSAGGRVQSGAVELHVRGQAQCGSRSWARTEARRVCMSTRQTASPSGVSMGVRRAASAMTEWLVRRRRWRPRLGGREAVWSPKSGHRVAWEVNSTVLLLEAVRGGDGGQVWWVAAREPVGGRVGGKHQ